MDQHAQVRPALPEVPDGPPRRPPRPGHALEQDHEPGRHAADQPQVLPRGERRHRLEPLVPLRDGRDRGPGRVQAAQAGRQPADGETGQVTDAATRARRPGRGAAAEKQHRAADQVARAHTLRRHEERIPAALSMRRERLARDGDHLVAGRGPGRLHPVSAPPRPRHAGFAVERALPEGSEMAVVADGNPLLVLRHRPDAAEAVGETELRIAGRRDQSQEHGLLDGRPVARHAAQLVPAPPGTPVEQRRRRARDHRPAPARRAGRSRARRVVSSQSATTRLKGSGRSSIGTWPQRARSQS